MLYLIVFGASRWFLFICYLFKTLYLGGSERLGEKCDCPFVSNIDMLSLLVHKDIPAIVSVIIGLSVLDLNRGGIDEREKDNLYS